MNRNRRVLLAPWVMLAALTPLSALADDAARISRLETEIQQLRTLVDEQTRRIKRLEDELVRRSSASAPQPSPRPRAGAMRPDAPESGVRQPWHAAAAWDRVAVGMTAEQVVGILGAPSADESVGSLRTLFYRGASPGGPPVSGHVNFKDNRLVAVVKPVF